MPDDKKAMISRLFSSIGDEIYLEDERFLDMATAISGSGPAYVFLTMEAMIDAGVHMGFPRHVAERLVMNTLLGSCLYAIQSGEHVSKLRNGPCHNASI
ncbi:pyrroline-5-carboxylate reductase dimerization-domain-containing protein [Baffinella frigidus]|nr:pyrroline-5-carboxylate reductase dimerization-domain-containing protein [Cryptophyta sp. CCMP2293]